MRRVYEVEIEVKESGEWTHMRDENVIAQDAVRAGQIAVKRAKARYPRWLPRAKNVRLVVALS